MWPQMSLELKSLRLYGSFIFINLIMLPGSYMAVMLLDKELTAVQLSYQLSGFMVASLVGSLVSLLGHRVSNLMQAGVLELYATLPVTIPKIILGQTLTYVMLTVPQIVAAFGISVTLSESPAVFMSVIGVLVSVTTLVMLGLALGFIVRNPFVAQGVLPLVAWILLLTAPIYYSTNQLADWAKGLLLLNPVTHAINVVRTPLGFPQIVDLSYSYWALSVIILALGAYCALNLRKVYVLEKLF